MKIIETVDYKTQTLQVLNHLKQYGSITSLEAISNYTITRLSASIHTLRDSGYVIRSDWESIGGKRWVRYIFDREASRANGSPRKSRKQTKQEKKNEAIALLRIMYSKKTPITDEEWISVTNIIKLL